MCMGQATRGKRAFTHPPQGKLGRLNQPAMWSGEGGVGWLSQAAMPCLGASGVRPREEFVIN